MQSGCFISESVRHRRCVDGPSISCCCAVLQLFDPPTDGRTAAAKHGTPHRRPQRARGPAVDGPTVVRRGRQLAGRSTRGWGSCVRPTVLLAGDVRICLSALNENDRWKSHRGLDVSAATTFPEETRWVGVSTVYAIYNGPRSHRC